MSKKLIYIGRKYPGVDNFIIGQKKYWVTERLLTPDESILKFREDAEYNDMKERLSRHKIYTAPNAKKSKKIETKEK